ncbi:hypothetical protein [Paraburkholderia bannensis]|uniref:hypothetical protein n=1 Tax=Paraburkholderia bannensis TaxID=765414 RepID=UPI002AC31EE0|nr:hypothetical protein [Paraburkholderia bannensis]
MSSEHDVKNLEANQPQKGNVVDSSEAKGLLQQATGAAVVAAASAIGSSVAQDVYGVLLHPLTIWLLDKVEIAAQHVRLLTFQSQLQSKAGELQQAVIDGDYYLRVIAEINKPTPWPDISSLSSADIDAIREAWKAALNLEGGKRSEISNRNEYLLSLIEGAIMTRSMSGVADDESRTAPRL